MRRNFNSFKDEEVIEYPINKAALDKLNGSRDIKNFEGGKVEFITKKNDEILEIQVSGEVELNLISAYTFKPFKTSIKIDDVLYFTDNKEFESEEVFLTPTSINFDEIIYSLILVSLPLNPHAEGENTEEIEGFTILKEEDVNLGNSELNEKLDKLLDEKDEK